MVTREPVFGSDHTTVNVISHQVFGVFGSLPLHKHRWLWVPGCNDMPRSRRDTCSKEEKHSFLPILLSGFNTWISLHVVDDLQLQTCSAQRCRFWVLAQNLIFWSSEWRNYEAKVMLMWTRLIKCSCCADAINVHTFRPLSTYNKQGTTLPKKICFVQEGFFGITKMLFFNF